MSMFCEFQTDLTAALKGYKISAGRGFALYDQKLTEVFKKDKLWLKICFFVLHKRNETEMSWRKTMSLQ